MNTKLTIKNFRVFDENGVMVDLNPITVLTGCNSSGKSSVVKAALMLNDVLRQLKDGPFKTNISEIKIDFTKYPNNLLGRFDKVLHDSKSGKITFEYTVYSYMISKDVTVSMDFVADKSEKMNNAQLDNFKVSIDDGVVFWTEKDEEAEKIRKKERIKRLEREKNDDTRGIVSVLDTESFIQVYSHKVNANLVKPFFADYAVFRLLTIASYNNHTQWDVYERTDEEFKETNAYIDKNFPKLSEQYHISDERLSDIAGCFADGVCKNSQDINIIENGINNETFFIIPIMEDLDKIEKKNFEKYVSDNDFVNYMASSIYSDGNYRENYLAEIVGLCSDYTKEVVGNFLMSNSEAFSDYFHKLEKDYFGNALFPNFSSFGCIDNPYGIMETWNDKSVFSKTYIVLMFWNQKLHPENNDFYEKNVSDIPQIGIDQYFNHKSVEIFGNFLEELFKECMCPSFYGPMTYISSSRATIKRLYQLDQKDDFTLLLKKYMESENQGAFLNKWIKKFGIGDSISFDIDEDGVGVRIHLHKTPDDKKGRLLADEGYGITQLLSIMLQIEMSGVYDNLTLVVEEPEIHLHPKYQSLLADMFVDARGVVERPNYESPKHSKFADKLVKMYTARFPMNDNGIHFIIETHSEYLIRRLQVLVAEKKLDKDEVSIAYIYTKDEAEKENQPRVKNIAICEDGYLDDTFGSGFFDEATKLSRKLL